MTANAAVASASAQVVLSVSHALRDIIVHALGAEVGLTASDFSVTAPRHEAPPRATAVSLFVYHLRPSPHVSSDSPVVEARGSAREQNNVDGAWPVTPTAEQDEARLPLELCYMVLPRAPEARSEQKLGAALAKLFHAFSTIHVAGLPESAAREQLLASGNARLRLVAQYPDMDLIRRFWSGPGDHSVFKGALYYRVLPVFLPAQADESLRRVAEIVAESRVTAR